MADIPGDTSTNASISVGGTVSGNLDFLGDHDWFQVTLTAGQTYTISVTGSGAGGLIDSYLNIYDSTGTTILAFDDDIVDGTNRNSLINFTAPTSGTYYLDVGAFQNQYIGAYQLSVQPYVPPPVATLDQIADQLVNGFWGGDAHHFNVTQGGTITVNISTLNPAEQNLARAALAEWSDIIGVTFKEVTSGEQITFDNTGAKAVAATDADWVNGIISHAHVHISTSWVNNYGTGLNTYSFQTYIHEIGHALGLGHAGDYNNTATYPNDALFQNDAWSTSIMSYFDQQENTYFGNQGFSRDFAGTPMGADILAMQTLYGLSTTTRAGDTTYGFNTNVGGIYDASQYPRAAYTIFDSGGNDTLDFSGSAANQLINLNPETFSNVDGQTGNLSIARGVVIENAIGGSGNDTLIGNSAINVLKGGGGSDTLSGGGGNDVFVDTITGHNGDKITDFNVGDQLVFSDATPSTFKYTLSGSFLVYSGGSMTLNGLNGSALVANSIVGGGVQLVLAPAATIHSHHTYSDFNGDGRSDILWRNDNGTITDWLGQANGGLNGNPLYYSVPNSWHVAGTSDFNGDGRSDVLWRNDDGTVTEWLGQVNGALNGSPLYYSVPNSWHIAGTGDFNGDGRSDILWLNDDGTITDWLGQPNGGLASNPIYLNISTSWRIEATGDFNGDGIDDILLRNNIGQMGEFLGQPNGAFVNNASFGGTVSADWHIIAAGDFNGDGRTDLLWRHDNGTVTDWLGQPSGGFSSNPFYVSIPTSWHVIAIGDFNGDGMDDMLLRSAAGQIGDWLGQPNGGFVNNPNFGGTVPADWHVQDPSVHDTIF